MYEEGNFNASVLLHFGFYYVNFGALMSRVEKATAPGVRLTSDCSSRSAGKSGFVKSCPQKPMFSGPASLRSQGSLEDYLNMPTRKLGTKEAPNPKPTLLDRVQTRKQPPAPVSQQQRSPAVQPMHLSPKNSLPKSTYTAETKQGRQENRKRRELITTELHTKR